ncbi:hypothetical protein RHOSPDRAFT_23479 [Rhodotorula sp. JG-1b]|nr:hypothetical protein RHOSPDRAFT_23479 [Rhodotorula sp. JG-1b]
MDSPASGALGARVRRWRAILPSARTLAWLVAIGAVAGYYQFLLHEERNAADRRTFALSRLNRSEKTKGSPSDLDITTTSCELCHHSPHRRMCEYGLDNIRLSRAYEGSGARLRKVLARGEQGHAINVGVLGASVTAGHGLAPGSPRWHEHFFSDFQQLFRNARMHVGAAGGVNSHFLSYCHQEFMPREAPIDLYLVEVDINNEPTVETMIHDDNLMRSLLDQPHEPAVIRVSVLQVMFDDLARGTMSSLLVSQYFDVPVIGIRNFLLPHVQHHRRDAELVFGHAGPNTDYRHISDPVHIALGDVVSLFIRKEMCELQRRAALSTAESLKTGPWPDGSDLGRIPPLHVMIFAFATDHKQNAQWRNPVPVHPPNSSCRMVYSHDPLAPLSHSDEFSLIEWNGKKAWSSSTPGAEIRFSVHGRNVGVILWATNGQSTPEERSGDAEVRKREAPGMANCWIEDGDGLDPGAQYAARSFTSFPSEEYALITRLFSPDSVLACRVSDKTTSGGHKWRIQGVIGL